MVKKVILIVTFLFLSACNSNQRQDIQLLYSQHHNLEKLLRSVSALDQMFADAGVPQDGNRAALVDTHIVAISQALESLPVGDCKVDSEFARFQRNLESLRENMSDTLLSLQRQSVASNSGMDVIQHFDNRITHFMSIVRSQSNVAAALKPKKEVFRLFRLLTELLSISSDIRLSLQKMRITNRVDGKESMKTLKAAYSMGRKLQTVYRGNPRLKLLPVVNVQARAVLKVLLSQYEKINVPQFDDQLQQSLNQPQGVEQFQLTLSGMKTQTLSEVDAASELIQKQLSVDEQGILCNDTSLLGKIKEKFSS